MYEHSHTHLHTFEKDLSRENLKIREDGLGGVYVEGLSEACGAKVQKG